MKNNKNGFTLIEIVVAMIILVIVFGVISSLVSYSTSFFKDESTQVSNQESLRLVAISFEKDVRKFVSNSTEINIDSINNCVTLGVSPSSEYCFNKSNNQISRNGEILAVRIEKFEITYDTYSITLNLVSIPDTREIVNRINWVVYFRNERSG